MWFNAVCTLIDNDINVKENVFFFSERDQERDTLDGSILVHCGVTPSYYIHWYLFGWSEAKWN